MCVDWHWTRKGKVYVSRIRVRRGELKIGSETNTGALNEQSVHRAFEATAAGTPLLIHSRGVLVFIAAPVSCNLYLVSADCLTNFSAATDRETIEHSKGNGWLFFQLLVNPKPHNQWKTRPPRYSGREICVNVQLFDRFIRGWLNIHCGKNRSGRNEYLQTYVWGSTSGRK